MEYKRLKISVLLSLMPMRMRRQKQGRTTRHLRQEIGELTEKVIKA